MGVRVKGLSSTIKKGYGFFVHSLFWNESAGKQAETKKAMGDLEAAHGLHFNSNVYDSTGHTSLSMFAQHHQLPLIILNMLIPSSSNFKII